MKHKTVGTKCWCNPRVIKVKKYYLTIALTDKKNAIEVINAGDYDTTLGECKAVVVSIDSIKSVQIVIDEMVKTYEKTNQIEKL